jgi:CelD/BcsL family acetyltransferase involved in cellulose biosynthesis
MQLDVFTDFVFEGAAQAVRELHSARWQQRGQNGVLEEPVMQRFLDSVLPALSGAGLLRLHTLRAGQRLIATLVGLRGREMSCF